MNGGIFLLEESEVSIKKNTFWNVLINAQNALKFQFKWDFLKNTFRASRNVKFWSFVS